MTPCLSFTSCHLVSNACPLVSGRPYVRISATRTARSCTKEGLCGVPPAGARFEVCSHATRAAAPAVLQLLQGKLALDPALLDLFIVAGLSPPPLSFISFPVAPVSFLSIN